MDYNKALEYATKKHAGQFRIGGLPYISHPVAVADILRDKGYGTEYQITALFHDLLEDTDATEEEILAIGNDEILEAVKLLTKRRGYDMAEYISGIKSNPMAMAVKSADRLHNLRCAVAADNDFKIHYAEESKKWYLDFDGEIAEAVRKLEESLL